MKKLLLSLVALMAIGVSAQNIKFAVDDVAVRQGGSTVVPINIVNSIDCYGWEGIIGVQDVNILNGDVKFSNYMRGDRVQNITYNKIVVDDDGNILSLDEANDGAFTIEYNPIKQDDGTYAWKIVGYNTGGFAMKDNSGAVAYITISVPKTVEVGTKFIGYIDGIHFSDSKGKEDYTQDKITFNIEVVENIITLDENSTTVPEAEEDVNVKVLRTIKANVWNTICLPFAMTEEQVKEAFGNDVQIADFEGCEGDVKLEELSGAPDPQNSVKVKFVSVSSMEANHPYLIKVSETLNYFTVNNVNIEPEADEDGLVYLDKDEYTYGSGRNKRQVSDSFIGTYVAETKIPKYGIFLSNNQFKSSVGKSKLNAFRAYFDFGVFFIDTDDSSSVKYSISLDEATAIDNIDGISVNSDEWYDLSGRKLDKTPKVKGIYINNGKKHLVK